MIDRRRWLDRFVEVFARQMAQRTSRRSVLTRFGSFLVGATLPVLPVARAAEDGRLPPPDDAALKGDAGDPKSCNYWRHCAIDGFLCACCGGSQNACPPGTEMSPITWIGTCRNPADQRNYIISYNDCCGGVAWGRCACQNNQGDRPVVRPQNNNEVTWCFGTKSQSYTCSTAVILGVAIDQK